MVQRGRAALFDLPGSGFSGSGLLCILKDGPDWTPVVVDGEGQLRTEWAQIVMDLLPNAVPLEPPLEAEQVWADTIRRLGAIAQSSRPGERLHATAYFRFV